MTNCDEARALILKHLMQDIEAHEEGRFSEIGGFDERWFNLDKCYEADETEAKRLLNAFALWAEWADCRNHDWGNHPSMEQKDWPILARQIHQSIVEKWEPDWMMDSVLYNLPKLPPSVPFWQSIWQRMKTEFPDRRAGM